MAAARAGAAADPHRWHAGQLTAAEYARHASEMIDAQARRASSASVAAGTTGVVVGDVKATHSLFGVLARAKSAEAALVELDKRLRSGVLPKQLEALLFVDKALDLRPDPDMVSSVFLKLGDVLQSGSNLLRYVTLLVLQRCEVHLGKVSNGATLVQRVTRVLESNDPLARAIALRVLGCLRVLVADNSVVVQRVCGALDSHNEIEQRSAVLTTWALARHSPTFARLVSAKVLAMLDDLGTRVDIKLLVLRVCAHLHRDPELAGRATAAIQRFLALHRHEPYVRAALAALSQLAIASLHDLDSHVKCLLTCLRTDPRTSVQRACLRHLADIVAGVPTLDTTPVLTSVLPLLPTSCQPIRVAALRVVAVAAASAPLPSATVAATPLPGLAAAMMSDPDDRVAVAAIQAICEVVCRADAMLDDRDAVIAQLDKDLCEALVLAIALMSSSFLPLALTCAVRRVSSVLRSDSPSVAARFAAAAVEVVQRDRLAAAPRLRLLIELARLHPQSVRAPAARLTSPTAPPAVLRMLLATQRPASRSSSNSLPLQRSQMLEALEHHAASSPHQMWQVYVLGREALLTGHFAFACRAFALCRARVTSHRFVAWLSVLHSLAEAEAALESWSTDGDISTALEKLCLAESHLASIAVPQSFQVRWLALRTALLVTLHELHGALSFSGSVTTPLLADLDRLAATTAQLCTCNFDIDTDSVERLRDLHHALALLSAAVQAGSAPSALPSAAATRATGGMSCAVASSDSLLMAARTLFHVCVRHPPCFFSHAPPTCVDLVVTPMRDGAGATASRSSDVAIFRGNSLILKLSGRVHQRTRNRLARAVSLSVSADLLQAGEDLSKATGDVAPSPVRHHVPLHRASFLADAMLCFDTCGRYLVTVRAELVDEQGQAWATGPNADLPVLVEWPRNGA